MTAEVRYVLTVLTSSARPLDSLRKIIPERNPLNVMSIRKYFGVKFFIGSCKSVLEYTERGTFFSLFSYLSHSWKNCTGVKFHCQM